MGDFENRKSLDENIPSVQDTDLSKPIDSEIEPIEETVPPAANLAHGPADETDEDHGAGTLGPANYYSEKEQKLNAAENPPPPAAPVVQSGFKEKVFKPFLWPVVTLVVICAVMTALLAVTNSVTEPIITENSARIAQETRKALLPEADNFEDITPDPLPAGVTSVMRAENGAGYVIESYANGYGGRVPAMVAFNNGGTITGVTFLENNETPGLGKKLEKDTALAAQFDGKGEGRVNMASIDGIANATISTGAAVGAVNAAIEYYQSEFGGTIYELPEDIQSQLLPGSEITPIEGFRAENTVAAYAGSSGSYIIVGQGRGIYGDPVYVAVALSDEGVVLGLWANTENESPGYGQELGENEGFLSGFLDKSDTGGVDVVTNATISSNAIIDAVQAAIDALPAAKEAA